MDHAQHVTVTRIAGALALGVLLLYGGMALATSTQDGVTLGAITLLTLAGTVAAVWGLARLGVTRLAEGTVFVLLGLAPAAAALGWWLTGNAPAGTLATVLMLNLLAGVATGILTAWLLIEHSPARAERRAPRVG